METLLIYGSKHMSTPYLVFHLRTERVQISNIYKLITINNRVARLWKFTAFWHGITFIDSRLCRDWNHIHITEFDRLIALIEWSKMVFYIVKPPFKETSTWDDFKIRRWSCMISFNPRDSKLEKKIRAW